MLPRSMSSAVHIYGLMVWMLFVFAGSAAAESAKDQLQGTIDRVIEVLQTIQRPQDINKNKSALRELLLTRFDFPAMAQQSLGNRWSELKGNENEFVSAFTDFVENAYMSTLGSYRGEKVLYDRDWVDGDAAEVGTRIVGGEGPPIKIGYKLHLKDGQWLVYDAVIDDVSVVENYRSQFARILKTVSLNGLIAILREKASGRS